MVGLQICILPTTHQGAIRALVCFVGRKRHSTARAGTRARILCAYSSFFVDKPCFADRQKHAWLCEASFRVTQHMHVLYSFLASAYSGLRLCCTPLWGTEIQGAGMWRPTYMKSCFSDGRCICSLAFLSRYLSAFLSIRRGAAEFQCCARFGAWNKQKLREKE